MEKTLTKSRKYGYIAALGMITIDVVYSTTALLFLAQVEDSIRKYELPLQVFIGIFLIIIGFQKVRNDKEIKPIEVETSGSLIRDYFTTFFIALANISSIFNIVVIYTALRLYIHGNYWVVLQADLGVFIGGASEWALTTYILTHFKKHLDEQKILKLSRLCGFAILVFGVFIMGNAVYKMALRYCI